MKTTPPGNPPRWAIRFFHWYCNDHLREAVLGDMLELYDRRRVRIGKRRADMLFVWNVLLFLQPFAIRQKNNTSINQRAMLQNYFIITWRTMSRQRMYTSIKIGGFALGLATCFLIFLFIRHELSYDKHYKNVANLYRVYGDNSSPGEGKGTAFPASMGPIMKREVPEVEKSGRLIPFYNWFNAGSNLLRRDDQADNTFEEGFAYADPELLEILEIPFVYGNQQQALDKPYTLVISQSKAEKYFPGRDPVGQLVILNEDKEHPYTIGGVMEDFPDNSHLQFDFLITLSNVEFWNGEQTSWCCWNYLVYVQLRPDADVKNVEQKMIGIRDEHYLGYLKQAGNVSWEQDRDNFFFKLQPVKDIYLQSDMDDSLRHGDIKYVYMFGGVAVFILLLACVNFVNLSTAKSANRAKEVGLRKVVGSVRGYLVRQFLLESILYSFVSFVLCIVIVTLALPLFNQVADKNLSIPWTEWWLMPVLVLAMVLIGVVAGLYPSFYLSAFKPIDVLKGSLSRGSKSSMARSVMVVFQFTTSIVLIIGTFVIYRQMQFILNTKVGFDKEQVVLLQGIGTMDKNQQTFRDEVLKLSNIKNVTLCSYLPVEGKRDQNVFWREGRSKIDQPIGAQKWYADDRYLATMGMNLLEGRNFMPDVKSDSQAVIVNQAMTKVLNLTNPIGERIQNNNRTYTVIGVVEDFHFSSLRDEIRPLCFVYGNGGSIAGIKVNAGNMKQTLAGITKVWDKFMPHQPIRYTFLDESYALMYADVQRVQRVFVSFSVLAVVVACLGLFALSAFMVEQRTKEISIRLVMGASVSNIFRLLTQNFLKLVLISFAIAAPVGWYFMKRWLQDFEYKADITWDVFVLAGSLSVIIAMLTVSFQAIRAALASPATTLRSE